MESLDFFFQAEDGIRDLVRSRGLGDVYKRQVLALDDGLVDLHAADGVVGLDGEQFLQRVRRTVGLHGPALHLLSLIHI